MTIQFQGYVVKLEDGMPGKERLTIHGEMAWVESGDITLMVPKEIAAYYRPGDPIQVTVIPLSPASLKG